MNKTDFLNNKGNIARLLIVAAAISGYIFIAAAGGADMLRMITFFASVIIYLVLPGMAFARWLGPKEEKLFIPLTMLYGAGFLAFVHCFAVRLGIVWLLKIVPAAVAVAFVVWCVKKHYAPKVILWHNGVVLWALLCLFFALTMSAFNAHPINAGPISLVRDMLWNIGNANALSNAFPAEDLRFSMVRFSYHYFTELVTAALHLVSGASCYDIGVFFAGPLFIAAQLAALYCFGTVFFKENAEYKSRAMIFMLFFCQCLSMWAVVKNGEGIFANTLLKHLVTNVNSQATATVFICVFLTLLTVVTRARFEVGFMHLAALFASFFVLSFSKGPQAAIILCAFAISMVWTIIFSKPKYGRAVLSLLGVVLIFGAAYMFLYSAGTNNSMIFSIFSMSESVTYKFLSPYADILCEVLPISGYVWLVLIGVINSFCMAPVQFSLWLCGLPKAIKGIFKLDTVTMLLNGVAVGGFVAYHIFWHESSSQVYFAMVSIIAMTMLAADQTDRFKGKIKFTFPLWIVLAMSLVTGGCMLFEYSAQGIEQVKCTLGILQREEKADAVTPYDEEAMNYLAANAVEDTVFATNRTSSTPYSNDGISNCYTALSGVQAYMEGWTYAETNMGISLELKTHKQDTNAAFFTADISRQQLYSLAQQEGVTCLVYAKKWPGEFPLCLEPDFENADVVICFLD